MDWSALALSARRANASYLEKDDQNKAAFQALGDVWVGQFQDDSHQATLSVDPSGSAWLSISGTRASQGELRDIYADTQLKPVPIKGGTATLGVSEGMQRVWDWALSTAPSGTVFNLTGHSLGGSRVQASAAFAPAEQIGKSYSFAAPKFVAADFFKSHADVLARMTCVVSGSDGWASWPWFDRRWQARPPIPHIWLKDDAGTFTILPDGNKWPGGWRFSDHDMDEYQARVEKIATMSMKPAA